MKEKKVTEELKDILAYMTNVLQTQYPCHKITSDYLIIAIIEQTNSHAYSLLSSLLNKDNLNEIKEIYINHITQNEYQNIKLSDEDIFSDELENILDNAENEQTKTNSQLLGSEHVLLSILNEANNNTKLIDVFSNMGIDYNIILQKSLNKNAKKAMKTNNFLTLKNDKPNLIGQGKNNYIKQFTISINQLVKEGKIDSLIGRTNEVNHIIKVLARRKKNNAVLVGNSGCGKTQIVYGIAEKIVNGDVPELLQNKEIVKLDIIALVSGTHFRGMFEERVNGLFEELKKSSQYILFIDDMQNVLKSSSKEKDTDITPMISNILSEGDIRVIGTTTFKDYKNTIENSPSINNKLQKIIIESTTQEETLDILRQVKKYYEDYHNVVYSEEVLVKTIQLAERYITNRSLPDSAIDILDLSGAHTCLINRYPSDIAEDMTSIKELEKEKNTALKDGDFTKVDNIDIKLNSLKRKVNDFKRTYESTKDEYKIEITVDDVANAVSDITSIPIKKLNINEKRQIADIDKILKKEIIGQDQAIDSICKIIKRNKIGLGSKNKTQGNVLLLGPSGVGKCVCGSTTIKIRNKKTLIVEEVTFDEFYQRIKNSKNNNL